MTTPITKQNYQIKNVEDIPKIVHEAFHVLIQEEKVLSSLISRRHGNFINKRWFIK